MKFNRYTKANAPEASREILESVEKSMGFVPEVYAYLAASPQALKAYVQLDQLLSESGLSEGEKQLALLTTSVTNRCEFCVAAHSGAATMAKVNKNTIAAVRRGETPEDPKLGALVRFVRTLVQERGWAPEAEVRRFTEAGYDEARIFDLITAVSLKTLSNYTNHLAQPELNGELESFAWDSGEKAA